MVAAKKKAGDKASKKPKAGVGKKDLSKSKQPVKRARKPKDETVAVAKKTGAKNGTGRSKPEHKAGRQRVVSSVLCKRLWLSSRGLLRESVFP